MLAKNNSLETLDIFPKIVPVGKKVDFSVRRLNRSSLGEAYTVDVVSINNTPAAQGLALTDDRAVIHFSCALPREEEYHVRFIDTVTGKTAATLPIYALDPDLIERRPLIGDFHAHTCYSDGRESPDFVAARYRREGFDFVTITDHRRYAPSQEAVAAFSGLALPFVIYCGEEVHAPGNYVHIVNFASDFSVNALALKDKTVFGWHSTEGEPVWLDEVSKLAETLDGIPDGIDPNTVAASALVSKYIRQGGGMSIFAHPHWLKNVRNVPDCLTEYFIDNGVFDAYELLGGQSSWENQSQTAMFEQFFRRGIKLPIVGSSDSHGVLNKSYGDPAALYRMFTEERTLVLAANNTREDIIGAVQGLYSAAIESYVGQFPHIYCASYRIAQYAGFLMREYFPLRDELYFEEGRLMHEYIAGSADAEDRLIRTVSDNAYFENKYIYKG